MKVFLLQQVHSFDNCEEDVKLTGIYSSRENAEAAIARSSQVSGFSADPAGFHVDEYIVDNEHWVEGYSTLANA